jgi:hypothetical protein
LIETYVFIINYFQNNIYNMDYSTNDDFYKKYIDYMSLLNEKRMTITILKKKNKKLEKKVNEL